MLVHIGRRKGVKKSQKKAQQSAWFVYDHLVMSIVVYSSSFFKSMKLFQSILFKAMQHSVTRFVSLTHPIENETNIFFFNVAEMQFN